MLNGMAGTMDPYGLFWVRNTANGEREVWLMSSSWLQS